jgi:alpha-galactosidase
VPLRGLKPGRYRLRDYVSGNELGSIASPGPSPRLRFEGHLLLEALPVTA